MSIPEPHPGLTHASRAAKEIFDRHKVRLTLGGEPTFLPDNPEGPEWSITAVGPTKLDCAYRMAHALIEEFLPGAMILFSPGKLYPGEVNPRWVVNLLWRADGRPIRASGGNTVGRQKSFRQAFNNFLGGVAKALGFQADSWIETRDLLDANRPVATLPLDHDGKTWVTGTWKWRNRGRLALIARNFLFHPLGALPAEGPGSEGVRGEVGGIWGHREGWSPESGPHVKDFLANFGDLRKYRTKISLSGHG